MSFLGDIASILIPAAFLGNVIFGLLLIIVSIHRGTGGVISVDPRFLILGITLVCLPFIVAAVVFLTQGV